jgi:hypothetical protein
MVRKKIFVLGQLEQPRQDKHFLYRHDKPNEPTKKEPLKRTFKARQVEKFGSEAEMFGFCKFEFFRAFCH